MLKRACRFLAGLLSCKREAKKASFSEEQKKSQEDLAIELLERWLAKHPKPDEKALCLGDRELSCRELVEEIKSRSQTGIDYLHALIELGLRDMLRKFG